MIDLGYDHYVSPDRIVCVKPFSGSSFIKDIHTHDGIYQGTTVILDTGISIICDLTVDEVKARIAEVVK